MATTYLDVDIREELKKLSDKFPDNQLDDNGQEFCVCFDFIPSEDYERICRYAKREEMKAEAFKDVMMIFLKYINFLLEDTNIMASSQLVTPAYQDTFRSAIHRFETLECELDELEIPLSIDY